MIRTTHTLIATALTAAALIACSPAERQQTAATADQTARSARDGASRAADSAGRAVDDAAVTARVKSALLADDQVKAMAIDVDTSAGTVTLTGNVANAAVKQRAEQLAQNVEGVKSVRNNLSAPG
jgi:hyperosmotically inducible protein